MLSMMAAHFSYWNADIHFGEGVRRSEIKDFFFDCIGQVWLIFVIWVLVAENPKFFIFSRVQSSFHKSWLYFFFNSLSLISIFLKTSLAAMYKKFRSRLITRYQSQWVHRHFA